MGDVLPVLAQSFHRRVLAACAVGIAFAAAVSCSKKHDEPVSRPEAYQAAPLPEDGGQEDAFMLKQWRTKLNHEACENAAKHANLVFGRSETDPKGAILLSRCLQVGNLAWYGCVMEATAPAQISACSKRYFDPAPR